MNILIITRRDLARAPYHEWIGGTNRRRLLLLTSKGVAERCDESVLRQYAAIEALDDFSSAQKFAQALDRLTSRSRPHRIVALSEFDILRAARARDRFDVPGQRYVSAIHFRDKLLTKQTLRRAGIEVPRFSAIANLTELIDFMRAAPHGCVLKVRRGAGSSGVWRLRDEADLVSLPLDLSSGVPENCLMAEEFVEGDIYHVDGLILAGRPRATWVSRYYAPPLAFRTGQPGGSYLLNQRSPLWWRLSAFALRCLRTLPTPRDTTFHADIFVNRADRLVAGEIASRTAGNRIRDMIVQSSDLDLDELITKVSTDDPVEIPRYPTVRPMGWAALRRIPGVVANPMPEPPYEWMHATRLHAAIGSVIETAALSATQNLWSFLAAGADETEVRERLAHGILWSVNALKYCVSPANLPLASDA